MVGDSTSSRCTQLTLLRDRTIYSSVEADLALPALGLLSHGWLPWLIVNVLRIKLAMSGFLIGAIALPPCSRILCLRVSNSQEGIPSRSSVDFLIARNSAFHPDPQHSRSFEYSISRKIVHNRSFFFANDPRAASHSPESHTPKKQLE